MKIRLIEPDAPSMHLWSKSYFVRLGLPIIGAALTQAGHDVRIYNPQLAPIDWDDVYTSELVGLSSTTSTSPAAYEIADALRRRRIPVIIGGSHVTFMAEEALAHADFVARVPISFARQHAVSPAACADLDGVLCDPRYAAAVQHAVLRRL